MEKEESDRHEQKQKQVADNACHGFRDSRGVHRSNQAWAQSGHQFLTAGKTGIQLVPVSHRVFAQPPAQVDDPIVHARRKIDQSGKKSFSSTPSPASSAWHSRNCILVALPDPLRPGRFRRHGRRREPLLCSCECARSVPGGRAGRWHGSRYPLLIARTSGNMALASATVNSFGLLRGFGRGHQAFFPFFDPNLPFGMAQQAAPAEHGKSQALAAGAGLGGGGGSGGFVQTGSGVNLDAATAIGLSVAWPQAISTGSLAKSTMQPSRL